MPAPKNRIKTQSLARTQGRCAPRTQIIAVAYDGERTEKRYFEGWKFKLGTVGAQIEPYFVKSGGNVLHAVEKCIERNKLDGPFSHFYCVCDIDDTSPGDLAKAISLAQSENIILCTSNRSFEIWIALHWDIISLAPINSEKEAVNLVSRHHKSYTNRCKEVPFSILYQLTHAACKNADWLEKQNTANPSTTVHSLVNKLLEIYRKREAKINKKSKSQR